MPSITEPLRLAVGSHQAGSGKGCAMNVISWENGDQEITDYPKCADMVLSMYVQWANDSYCVHRDKWSIDTSDLLCAECSSVILELAHRTVGTAMPDGLQLHSARRAAADAYDRIVFSGDPWPESRLVAAHAAIDAFEQVAGIRATPVALEVTERAYAQMVGAA